MHLVLAARSASELEHVAAELTATGAEAIAVPTDIRHRASLAAPSAAATRAFGSVDVLVKNAGGDPLRPFDQYAAADVDDVLSVNLSGPSS